jgi:DNA oxidative demethylase
MRSSISVPLFRHPAPPPPSSFLTVLDAPALASRITYHPAFLPRGEADTLFAGMLWNTPWQTERPIVCGKPREVRRRTCAYGATDGLTYGYSGLDQLALPWPAHLLPVLTRLEADTGAHFNFGLCNLYPDGLARIGRHADDEDDLVPGSPIAGLSLGAARDFFVYDRATRKRVASITLEHGSLIVMWGSAQRHFQHAVPKRTHLREPRISVTFRIVKTPDRAQSG